MEVFPLTPDQLAPPPNDSISIKNSWTPLGYCVGFIQAMSVRDEDI